MTTDLSAPTLTEAVVAALQQHPPTSRELAEVLVLLFRKWQETVAGTPYDPEAAIALLRSWAETTDPEEIQDQKGTMALLRKELNRGSPKGYEIFP